MQRGFSTPLVPLLLLVLGFVGFLLSKQSINLSDLPGIGTPKEVCHPKIDYKLCKLIESNNPLIYVKENNLDFEDYKVRVTIELLETTYTLPDEYGIEETRTSKGDLLQAKIELDKLIEVADSPEVRNVRSPQKAMPL